jgi:(p)ppGpp synthase/HD superfamily hydrolase
MKDNFGEMCEEAIRVLVEHMPTANRLIKPTLLHSIRVGTYLYNNNYPQNIVLGGYLHDVIEDTEIRNDFLEKKFGKGVLDIILANSKDTSITKDSNQELLRRCLAHGEDALIVKIADILDNYTYYSQMDDQKGLDYCSRNTEYLLQIVPSDFENGAFTELVEFHSKVKN